MNKWDIARAVANRVTASARRLKNFVCREVLFFENHLLADEEKTPAGPLAGLPGFLFVFYAVEFFRKKFNRIKNKNFNAARCALEPWQASAHAAL